MHSYEGLTRYNKDYQVEPRWRPRTTITPTQVRFDLRKGVKFADGSPFTADDVVFSFGHSSSRRGTMVTSPASRRSGRSTTTRSTSSCRRRIRPSAQHRRLPHHEQGLGGEEQDDQHPGLQEQGRQLRLAQRRHRPLQDHRLAVPTRRSRWSPIPTEGQACRQRDRGRLHADRPDPTRRGAALGDVDLLTDLPTQDVARLRTDPKLKILDGGEVRTIFIALDQGSEEPNTPTSRARTRSGTSACARR